MLADLRILVAGVRHDLRIVGWYVADALLSVLTRIDQALLRLWLRVWLWRSRCDVWAVAEDEQG